MQNIFLLIRSVFFALLINLNLLTLIFSAWNISASSVAGLSVPATSIFIVFESCLLFACVALALAELFRPRIKTSYIPFECGWVALLSVFEIGAAISVVANGPLMLCRGKSDWEICVSVSLLLPVTWLKSLVSFSYFLALFFTSMAHVRDDPELWSKTMYTVGWFNSPRASSKQQPQKRANDIWEEKPHEEENPYSRYLDDIESTSSRKLKAQSIDTDIPAPWARVTNVRRGVDAPFAKRDGGLSTQTSPQSMGEKSLPLTPIYAKMQASKTGTVGSRFIEKFRESRVLSRSETPSQYGSHFMTTDYPPVIDHDLPIPLPRLSEWVRADALRGINVHTVPHAHR